MSEVAAESNVETTRKSQHIETSLYPAIFFLKLLGIWHFEGKIGVLYRMYGHIMLFLVGSLYAASMLMYVIEVWGNLHEMTDAIYLLVTIISLTLKCTLLDYKQMIAMISLLSSEHFNRHVPEQDVFINTAMYICKRNSIVYLLMCTTVCWSWLVIPVITGAYQVKKLPFKGWYPFKTDSSPVYEMTCMYQFLGVWFGALINASMDTLASGLMVQACGQLEVLKHSLAHIRQQALRALNRHDETCSCGDKVWQCLRPVHLTQNSANFEQEVYKQVVQCILHHQAIVEFVNKLESTFTASIFAQVCAGAIAICITGVELSILDPYSFEFVTVSLYCMAITVEIFFYCWYGNELFLTSTTVGDAVYMSDWHRFGPRVNKLLFIIMERSKRPLRLTAGKLFQLSLDTFTSILRSAYSLCAVIRQMDMEYEA
ncbi:Odorant receptor 83a [Carabus blaptoides fortunei]